jgi:spore photoproduct lyase
MFNEEENRNFPKLKQHLIIGVRKTHKYVPNHKVSDWLVPYTSSGCRAMCLYCYLVCNYNKCSYLRLFVNREQMMEKLLKTDAGAISPQTFEIGSNSDLVLWKTRSPATLYGPSSASPAQGGAA